VAVSIFAGGFLWGTLSMLIAVRVYRY